MTYERNLVKEELLKPEDELMKEVVDFWIHVEQENKIRNERIKRMLGEEYCDE
jgi:hypothetical protein